VGRAGIFKKRAVDGSDSAYQLFTRRPELEGQQGGDAFLEALQEPLLVALLESNASFHGESKSKRPGSRLRMAPPKTDGLAADKREGRARGRPGDLP
jgi:hypothetical protein